MQIAPLTVISIVQTMVVVLAKADENNKENEKLSVASWGIPIMANANDHTSHHVIKPVSSISTSCEMPSPPVKKQTHWVIPGRILVGSTPSHMTSEDLQSIVNSGVDTFVNLQQNYNEYSEWFHDGESTDYRKKLRKMTQSRASQFPPHRIDFVHCPIPDHDIIDDSKMCAFIEELRHLLGIIY